MKNDSHNFLNTNTLTFESLSNTSYSSNQSVGASANYTLEGTTIVNGESKPQEGGISSATYTASNSLGVSASKTLATLGKGNVTVNDIENSDEQERLNRDTLNVNKDLYSNSTGTSVDATLDTRLLSLKGLNDIKNDFYTTSAITNAIEQRNMLIIFLIKFVIFLFLLSIIFFIEQLFLQLFLYGLDAPGYLQNNGMIENIKRYSDLTWNEKLYWKFIFTLYYPIYIFIFLKPFVNHLDKSIKNKNKGK